MLAVSIVLLASMFDPTALRSATKLNVTAEADPAAQIIVIAKTARTTLVNARLISALRDIGFPLFEAVEIFDTVFIVILSPTLS